MIPMKAQTIIVPLSEGFEEMEAVVLVDVLRRAGLQVVTAATGTDRLVHGAHAIDIVADALWDEVADRDFDAIAIPGGMGGTRINQADARVLQKVSSLHAAGKLVAAICAGPLVLQAAGVFEKGDKATCYPGLQESEFTDAEWVDAPVVENGGVITSQGPGTAYAFGLAIVQHLRGKAVRSIVAEAMVLK
jgi:4-methyl-5(b-hydroxyethyl)-thiazole monophosphate biosynthesis